MASLITKEEWERTEIPVPAAEMTVLRFLCEAAKNTLLKRNACPTLYTFLKVEPSEKMDEVLAEFLESGKVPANANSATRIRLENSAKSIPSDLYEKRLMAAMADKDKVKGYFLVHYLLGLHVLRPNPYVQEKASKYLEEGTPDLRRTVLRAPELFALCDTPDLKLYEYQQEMYELQSGLVELTAPTGTGKTLLPIGYAEKGLKVLYVCDRPTALDFAQKCISVGRKIALAFGCTKKEDVRLHRAAAEEYTKNAHTGAVGKVNNMVGDKVEILVADVASAEVAMEWWAHQKKTYDLLYWDEPDKDKHTAEDQTLWPAAQRAWQANTASFIVLSSATLPLTLPEVEAGYQAKFPECPVHRIGKRTVYNGTQVALLNEANEVVMPHHVFQGEELLQCAETMKENPSLLRYVDLNEAVKVLHHAKGWEDQMTAFSDAANPITIKKAYLSVMHTVQVPCTRLYESVIRATREDAWTISGGAAIYMTRDVEKVGVVMLKAAGIPETELSKLMRNIEVNGVNAEKRAVLQKEFENAVASDAAKANKMADERYSNPAAKQLLQQIKMLERLPVKLDDAYVPNTAVHVARWKPGAKGVHAPDLDERTVERIVDTNAADHWKVLLLMGVAVLSEKMDKAYLEIVKQTASDGRLFMIVADFAYLTGTNYQFAHGYFGKDLVDLSQSMVVQALGRIGRGQMTRCTARIREPGMYSKLFGPADPRNSLFLAQVFSC
jgi:hypothetical protein